MMNCIWVAALRWTMTCPACGQDPCDQSTTDCTG